MEFNQATDYAFRAVQYLANQPRGKVVEAQAIAKNECIPIRFLLKIMPSLIKNGIIGSQRGAGGGYFLAREPKNITFFDIIEAVEGPVAINRCLVNPDCCGKKGPPNCMVHRILAGVQEKLITNLKEHTLFELIK